MVLAQSVGITKQFLCGKECPEHLKNYLNHLEVHNARSRN